MNAALPPQYHVTFDTDVYNEKIKHPVEIFCTSCRTKHKRDEIKSWDMLLSLEEQLVSNRKTIKAWTCNECNKKNILEDSKLIQEVTQEPFFTKVVPFAPERRQEVGDRTSYHIKYRAWFGMVVAELTRQISQLRWDHWKQGDENMDNEELKSLLQSNLEGNF